MIIDLKRSIDLRWLLMASAIFISDDLVHCYLTFWVSWYLWQNVQFKNIYIVDNLHVPGIFQAIFNHMGPNMARGWQGDSAGTKVIIFSFFLYLFRCPQLLLQSDLLFLLFDFYNFLLLRWSLKGGNLTTELHKY